MLIVDPSNTKTADFHQFLLGAVSPRPIALASTVDKDGNPNLAPYSFFNCFSSNPPILVFSSNRRVADNTTKDTLANIKETGEVVINAVSHAIVRQMAVSSISFPTEVSEFTKTGLTPIASDLVKPYRVKESPVQMECKLKELVTLGDQGGAGHLIICEVVRMHIDENVVDENNRIDPHKIDLMGRMGRAFYVRASGDAVQPILQKVTQISIGYDQLPESIRNSKVLSANNLGQLAGLLKLPNAADITILKEKNEQIKATLASPNSKDALQKYAKEILDLDDSRRGEAAAILMLADEI